MIGRLPAARGRVNVTAILSERFVYPLHWLLEFFAPIYGMDGPRVQDLVDRVRVFP
jgi:hypothetical protein